MYTVTIPRLEGDYTGTGDLVAALLLAWSARHRLLDDNAAAADADAGGEDARGGAGL